MRTVWILDDAKATCLIKQGATVTEVAERLGVSRQAVHHAIRKGRVPAPSARLGESPLGTNGTPAPAPRAGTSPPRD